MTRRRKRLSALLSSVRMDYATPRDLAARITRVFGRIALDPCANRHSRVRASVKYFTRGLERPWPSTGLVFVNPPYGRDIGAWTDACRRYGNCGGEVLMLLPARVDTAWWDRLTATGARVALFRGRLKFELPGQKRRDPAPFPAGFVYFGRRTQQFERLARASKATLWRRLPSSAEHRAGESLHR